MALGDLSGEGLGSEPLFSRWENPRCVKRPIFSVSLGEFHFGPRRAGSAGRGAVAGAATQQDLPCSLAGARTAAGRPLNWRWVLAPP